MRGVLVAAGFVLAVVTFAAAGHGLWYQVSAMRQLWRDPIRSGSGSVRERLDDAASRWLAGSLAALAGGVLAFAAAHGDLVAGGEVALAAGALAVAVWPWPSLRRGKRRR